MSANADLDKGSSFQNNHFILFIFPFNLEKNIEQKVCGNCKVGERLGMLLSSYLLY